MQNRVYYINEHHSSLLNNDNVIQQLLSITEGLNIRAPQLLTKPVLSHEIRYETVAI